VVLRQVPGEIGRVVLNQLPPGQFIEKCHHWVQKNFLWPGSLASEHNQGSAPVSR
jgi:hypothetical protein